MAFGLIRKLPDGAGIDFLRWRMVAFAVSGVLALASIAIVAAQGLNFGIDFRGGVAIQAGVPQAADVRDFIGGLDLGDEVATEITEDPESRLLSIGFAGTGAVQAAERAEAAMVGEGEEGDRSGGRFACAASQGVAETDAGASLVFSLPPNLPDIAIIRDGLGPLSERLGQIQLQNFGGPNGLLVRVEAQPGDETRNEERATQDAGDEVALALQGVAPMCILSTEVIGAKVSGELFRSGVLAMVIALALILIYIAWRFEVRFALGAIAALVHDVVLTIGMFALTQLEFNLSTVAAILTIIGYSLNDTVVVYDRIREKMRKYKKMDLPELLNLAINKTLSRTIMTSVTTLLALIALVLFGGPVLFGFAIALIWGVVIGTYSSIFIAAPFLLLTGARSSSFSEEEGEGASPATTP